MNRRVDGQAAFRPDFFRFIRRVSAYWTASIAVVAVIGLSSALLYAETASSYFKHGQAAEAREDYDTAFENYQKANAKNPKDLEYRAALARLRITVSSIHVSKGYKLLNAGSLQEALTEFLRAAQIDPGNEAAQQAIAAVRNKQGEAPAAGEPSVARPEGTQENLDSMATPAILKPVSNEPVTLHMSEDAKVIYQAVGKAAGVNVLFDPDFTSKRIQVDLNNVSLLDALRIVGTVSNTFWRPVTSNTVFVAANSRSKRTELDEQAVQTFYLSNAWQANDLTDVQTAIRNVLTNVKIYAVPSQNAIVMRATPDELLLAQKLINDLDKARAEVVVDIAIMEVSKNWEKTLGIAWPQSVSVALKSSSSSTTTTSSSSSSTTYTPSLYDLAHLKASNFAVTVGGATANMLLTDSNTKILQNPRIRATDSQKATMKIGSKIPVATGSYSSSSGTSASGLVNTQFQYQDVGVNIEMTPTVHFDRDVTLKMKIEVTTHSGDQTISGVTEPIISQRVVDQVIRLREGEATILGGIQEKDVKESWSGVPGLSSIPLLRYLFGSKDKTISDDELVFLVVPHVVRSQSLDAVNLRSVDTGVGTSIDIRHVPSAGPVAEPGASPAPPPARPQATVRPNMDTVPGQSAAGAVPAAMAQLRQAAETNGKTASTLQPPTAAAPAAVPAAASAPNAPAAQSVNLVLNALSGPVTVGTTFQVPVVLTGGRDIASVPLKIQYDSAKLSLVNVDQGDFLGRDGKPVTLLHTDDGSGLITVNSARPPGSSGMSGAGVVCVLSFQAKAAGDSSIVIAGSGVATSAMKQVTAKGNQISVQVR
jgi:general secretion pathway protein D